MEGVLMDDAKLQRLAGKENVPIGTLEKDYAVTNILSLISRFPKLYKMVFKGGTSIKKVHFNDFRFSEDIDFTCSEDISEDLSILLDGNMHNLDVNFTEIRREAVTGNSKQFTVKYRGFNNWPNSVKIDLSLRESVQNEVNNLKVLHNYEELPSSFSIPSMTLEEIMAEKVRAIIYSGAPRHLYDLRYLFGKQISLNPELVRTKISIYGDDFNQERFNESVAGMGRAWVRDLERLLPRDPPPFNEVSTEVLKKVSEVMKS